MRKISIVIEKDDYGYYAYCPELPGCQSQGDNFEEVLSNIREAAELYLETLSPDEQLAHLSKELDYERKRSHSQPHLGRSSRT